jgi:hypothetical protein
MPHDIILAMNKSEALRHQWISIHYSEALKILHIDIVAVSNGLILDNIEHILYSFSLRSSKLLSKIRPGILV